MKVDAEHGALRDDLPQMNISTQLALRSLATAVLVLFVKDSIGDVAIAESREVGDRSPAVTYPLSDGFDLLASLTLRPDGSFEFAWDGCLGPIARASGSYVSDVAFIGFNPRSAAFRKDARTFSDRMHRVPWGQREYLIPEELMFSFVNAVNAGQEPRATEMGLFYLRTGDEAKTAVGSPGLPTEWLSFLLPKPLTGKVVRVEQRETATRRPLVVIDAGARDGLKPGMQVYASNPRGPSFRGYLTVLDVTTKSATATVTFQYNHIRAGDSWRTRLTERSSP